MKLHMLGMCRGDGKGYIKLRVESSLVDRGLSVKSRISGERDVPANVYPLEHVENGTDSVSCVVVVPLLSVPEQRLTVRAGGDSLFRLRKCRFTCFNGRYEVVFAFHLCFSKRHGRRAERHR